MNKNRNRPTPETDAYYWRETGLNPKARSVQEFAEFARRLERERDEARDCLRRAMQYCPDHGVLSGCAMPLSLWDRCEATLGKKEGGEG